MNKSFKSDQYAELNTIRLWFVWVLLVFSLPLSAVSFPDMGADIRQVRCKSDTSVWYSIFVPVGYTGDTAYPIVICFDSHGNGALPLTKMKSAANRCRYIIAGSDNSKNGQGMDVGIRLYELILNDIRQNYFIDSNRIYTCGFSGGARVAAAIGLLAGGIQGVIGCGAGFPGLTVAPQHVFDYLAVAGDSDFNYTELENLMKNLDSGPIPHHFLQFQGGHAWPEGQTVNDIFAWMELRAMQHKLIKPRPVFIDDLKMEYIQRIEKLRSGKNHYRAWSLGNSALYFLESLTNCDTLKSLVKSISLSSEFIEYQKETDRLSKLEAQKKYEYPSYFFSKSMDWWRNELAQLRATTVSSDPRKEPVKLMNQRILAFLSLAAYMQCNSLIKSGDQKNALRMIDLYKLIDPENTEPDRMRNELMQQRKKK